MLIEFRLPHGVAGLAASHCYSRIKAEIEAWTVRYNVTYTDKLVKYTYRVCFDDDRFYSLFQLTWDPDPGRNNYYYKYRIITDRERDLNS